jgi:hypothetical protein
LEFLFLDINIPLMGINNLEKKDLMTQYSASWMRLDVCTSKKFNISR